MAHLSDQVDEILGKELGEKGFVLESQSEIGSSVSAVLRNKAIQAILISLAGVIVYLAFRFDLSFGLAAAIATFHDVLVVLGICWLLKCRDHAAHRYCTADPGRLLTQRLGGHFRPDPREHEEN